MSRDALFILSFVFTIFSFLFVQYYRREIDTNRQRLDSANDRREIKKKLQQTASIATYIGSVRRIESVFRYFMGPSLSLNAFFTVWGFATIYPIIAMFLAWMLGAPTSQLEDHFLSEGGSGAGIFYRAFNILLIPALCVYFKMSSRFLDITKWVISKISFIEDIEWAQYLIAFAISALTFLYVTIVVPGSFSNLIAALMVFGILTMGSAFQFAIPIMAIGSGVIASTDHALVHALLLVVFFFILPLCNAIVDFMSWALTRYFLKSIAREERDNLQRRKIAIDIILDVIAALFCLFILVALMANAIIVTNMVSNVWSLPAIPWQEYLLLALNDPWGDGIFINLMLVSTLLPTFIHLTIGAGGLIASLQPNFAKTANLITVGRKNQLWVDLKQGSNSLLERDQVARQLVFRQSWIVGAAIPVGLVLLLCWIMFANLLHYFQWGMGNVAICATAWDHGHCPALW